MTLNASLQALFVLFFITTISFAQKKDEQYLISEDISIDKYHDRDQLESMSKGKLLTLYNRRIEIIIKILPNIAFATKPGVTMTSLGIPNTKDNRRALKENIEATTTYFDNTIEFQKIVLPYSDRSGLVRAILFYEDTLKALHTYDSF